MDSCHQQERMGSHVCSFYSISGKKNDNLSSDYVPSTFKHVDSPLKRKKKTELEAYNRRKQANPTRLENVLQEEQRKEQAAKNKAAEEAAARALVEFQTSVAVMDFESRVAVQTDLSGEDVQIVEENLHVRWLQLMRMLTQGLLESDNSKVPDVITASHHILVSF